MLGLLLKYRLKAAIAPLMTGRRLARSLIVILAFIMLAFALGSFSYGIYQFARLDPERGGLVLENLVALDFHGAFVFLLFWGFSQAVFTIFFSADLGLLLTLPIPRRDIFAYKVIEATFLNSRISLLFLVPMLIVLGLFHGSSSAYYVIAAAVVIMMAVIPGSIGIIVASLLARRIPRARLKGAITVIGAVIGVTIWATINQMDKQYFSRSEGLSAETMEATRFLTSPLYGYLPSGWAHSAATGAAAGNWAGGFLYLLILVAGASVTALLAYRITAGHYAEGIAEEVAAPVAAPSANFEIGGSPLLAHIRRDILLLSRESGVIVQSLIIAVFMLLFPFVGVGDDSLGQIELPLSPMVALFAVFFGGQVGSRLVPLERLALWRNLTIPSGRRMAIFGKVIIGLVFVTVVTAAVAIIHLLAGRTAGPAGVFLAVFFAWIGLSIGLPTGVFWGNFNWDNPKRMLKGGGGFFYALAIVVAGAGTYLLTFLLHRYLAATVNPAAIILVLSLGFLTISIIVSALGLMNMEWNPDV
jgi:ABC-2 type transport system permease protein